MADVSCHDSDVQSIGFDYWLHEIPLLPKEIVDPLCDNYRSCSMLYENFSDCYSGSDEKAFRDDAMEKIQAWLDQF